MKKAVISAVLALSIACMPLNCTFCTDSKAYAESQTNSGLIEKCSVSFKTNENKIYINAKTQATATMTETGFLDIRIQHSDDCINWTDEVCIGDISEYGKRICTLKNFSVNVSGGYYYRVTCTHFAKGVPFTESEEKTQYAQNTSTATWVNQSQSIQSVQTTSTSVQTTDSTTTTTSTTTSTTEKTDVSSSVFTTSPSEPTAQSSATSASSILTSQTSLTSSTNTSTETNSETGTSAVTSAVTEKGNEKNLPRNAVSENTVNTGVNPPAPLIFTALGSGAFAVTLRKNKRR